MSVFVMHSLICGCTQQFIDGGNRLTDKEMASYSALKSRITEITTCSICLEHFKSPRSLPCLHSFCLKCLEGHCKNKLPGTGVPCPLCRETFQIPQSGLNSLRVNFFLEELEEIKDASNVAPGSESCEACSTESATFCCIDCSQKLCERCSLPHKKMRRGPHDVRPLGPEPNNAELNRQRRSYCDKHPRKRLKLYCLECKRNICMKCCVDSHRQHLCEEIEKVAKDFAASMKSVSQPFPPRIANYRNTVTRVETENKRFLSAVKKVKQEVQRRGVELKTKVDRHVSEVLRELEHVESRGQKEAKTLVEDCDLAVTAMESFQCYSSVLNSKGSPYDITREANGLHVRANELLRTYNPPGESDYHAPDVMFIPSDFDKMTRGKNVVGSLQKVSQSRGVHPPLCGVRNVPPPLPFLPSLPPSPLLSFPLP